MTMPRIFNAVLLVLSLLVPTSFAHANRIVQLKQFAFGCAEKADSENLTRLMKELPEGTFRTEAVLAYGNAHCVQLSRGRVRIYWWDGAYACVYRSPHSCLWIQRELIEMSPILDDGVL